MSDYLIWAAEKLEQKYHWKYEYAVEWLMSTDHIPYDLTIQKYLEETK